MAKKTLGMLVVVFLAGIFSDGCAKANVAETTPEFVSQPAVINVVKPKVKVWPDYIEIKAEVKNVEGADYYVTYKYFKETKWPGVEALLLLEPLNTTEKLSSEIYINELGKIEKVRIWGVGEYECSLHYDEMCGSLCQAAEDKYTYFCAAERMNCETTVNEILLKELWEWL